MHIRSVNATSQALSPIEAVTEDVDAVVDVVVGVVGVVRVAGVTGGRRADYTLT